MDQKANFRSSTTSSNTLSIWDIFEGVVNVYRIGCSLKYVKKLKWTNYWVSCFLLISASLLVLFRIFMVCILLYFRLGWLLVRRVLSTFPINMRHTLTLSLSFVFFLFFQIKLRLKSLKGKIAFDLSLMLSFFLKDLWEVFE
jgi:hypothetical protein